MAGFRTHITVSSITGIVYGGVAVQPLGFSTELGFLAAGLTAVGGMLPDLDSDSGVPVRELSGLSAAVIPLLLMPRLIAEGVSQEGMLTFFGFMYLFIRYGASKIFRKLTVHRGMWHSIPAMVIAGLVIYLEYHSPDRSARLLLATGVMLGFLSHLILDEIYSVDFNGVRLKLKSSAGSAVKFFSPSWFANCTCYGILGGLASTVYMELVNDGVLSR
jgi:membrane-bound metal-dependent hydrolase YbcI (DUF457 family)